MYKIIICLLLCGCTSESTRIALEQSQRIENIQDTLVQNLHDTALLFMYRDFIDTIPEAEQLKFLEYNKNRDQLEFWMIQWERARALRLITLDSKLISNQSIIDLLIKRANLNQERISNVTTNP